MNKIVTVIERGENLTAVQIDGVEIWEGSGEHTREAGRELAVAFALALSMPVRCVEEEGDGDWS